jgi:hypothetical protein
MTTERPSAIVTARGFSPDRCDSASLQKMRAARDAGDLPIPTVHVRKVESTWSCLPQVPGHPQASRARCLIGLLRTNPGGLTWPSLLRTGRSLSTAGRGPTPDAPYLGYERPRPGDPNCGARRARRAPCGLGRHNRLAKPAMATAPDPHSKTPRETPLVDQDDHEYNPISKSVNCLPDEFIPAISNYEGRLFVEWTTLRDSVLHDEARHMPRSEFRISVVQIAGMAPIFPSNARLRSRRGLMWIKDQPASLPFNFPGELGEISWE